MRINYHSLCCQLSTTCCATEVVEAPSCSRPQPATAKRLLPPPFAEQYTHIERHLHGANEGHKSQV